MAWRAGNDPYRLYNSLDSAYRSLTYRHPCPACWAVPTRPRLGHEPCHLCKDRAFVEIPLAEPGEMLLPVHPERLRNFIYGCARALSELDAGQHRVRPTRRARERS